MDSAFHPVILFDGVCNLCHAAVLWVMDRDPKGVFRFASLQSEAARELLKDVGELPDSVVLVDEEGVHTRSEAAVRIAMRLGWPYRAAAVGRLMPGFVRDAMYGWIARNRYGWFGRQEVCRVPSGETAGRFLDAEERIVVPPAAPVEAGRPGWALRWLWCYLLLRVIPIPHSVGKVVVGWIGERVFGVSITVMPNGSGDTTYSYVECLMLLVVALGIGVGWRWRLPGWSFALVHLVVRYSLGLVMLGYGWAKLVPMQFPAPGPARLIEPLGSMSPMGLLWTMMGASTPYQMFTGFVEVATGLLLLFPATALLGAIAAAVVTAQIVALNYCFDVPVKLYSTHLFLMSCVLIAPEVPRIASFFVLRLPAVAPPVYRLPLPGKWWPRVALGLKTLVVVGFGVVAGVENYSEWKMQQQVMEASPLHGLYYLEAGDKTTNPYGWARVGFTGERLMAVVSERGAFASSGIRHDAKARTIEVLGKERDVYRYSKPSAKELVLEVGEKRIVLKKETQPSLLFSRGFRWIQEYPFNR